MFWQFRQKFFDWPLTPGSNLELQVLTFVIPLKQNTALSPALVEALQSRLVLLHLLHYVWAQIHHGLVVTDGQDQYVARSQAALRHCQVTLQTWDRVLSVSGTMSLWPGSRFDTHMRPDADDEVFLHLRAGQTEPAGTGGLSCAQSKISNKGIVDSLAGPHTLVTSVTWLTGPAGLFGVPPVMTVPVVMLSSPPFALGRSLPAPSSTLLQVEEELTWRLLNRKYREMIVNDNFIFPQER